MKNFLILLLFVPFLSVGQDDVIILQNKTSISSKTTIENELVLSDEKTTIKTPLTADLSNYTHLLIVDARSHRLPTSNSGIGLALYNSRFHREIEGFLGLSIFTIMNPFQVDKRRFKKEPTFLKTIKKESYLYLYINEVKGKGDDINTTFIVRDWKNKRIYSSSHINTGLNEILAPLIDY